MNNGMNSQPHLVANVHPWGRTHVDKNWPQDILWKISGKKEGLPVPHFFCFAMVLGAIIVAVVLAVTLSQPEASRVAQNVTETQTN
jgi:hypothetical protein